MFTFSKFDRKIQKMFQESKKIAFEFFSTNFEVVKELLSPNTFTHKKNHVFKMCSRIQKKSVNSKTSSHFENFVRNLKKKVCFINLCSCTSKKFAFSKTGCNFKNCCPFFEKCLDLKNIRLFNDLFRN